MCQETNWVDLHVFSRYDFEVKELSLFAKGTQPAMRLRDWMDKTNIDVFEAARAFGVSIFAVKKWLRGDRTPRPATQAKIKKVTKGSVGGEDWLPKG